jgi:hypothetical protein
MLKLACSTNTRSQEDGSLRLASLLGPVRHMPWSDFIVLDHHRLLYTESHLHGHSGEVKVHRSRHNGRGESEESSAMPT